MIHARHRASSTLAVTLALLAGAAAPAMAVPDLNPILAPSQTRSSTAASTSPCSEVCSGGGYGIVSHRVVTSATLPAARPHASQPTVVRVVTHSSGFDWGDAAIGAGGAIIFVLVAFGGARATATRRAHPLGENPASAAR
jgi:hypothetical protein